VESANPTNEQQPKERRFKVGDIVCWTNDNGVKWHARRIIGFDDPDKWGHRYYLEPTDAPWMYTREKNLALETLDGDVLERTLSHDYSLRKFCERHPHYLGDVVAFIAKRRQLHLSEAHGKMPQCNLVVDGTDDGGNLAGDGEKYPFVVFDIDAQENIAGPFKTRADGETAREAILAGAAPVLDSAALLAILEAMDEGKPPEVTFQAGQQVMFTSTDSDAKRNGKVNVEVEIVRPLTDQEADLDEVGKMYKIRFADGHIEDAFVDELSAGKLPAPTKYRDGTAGNVIALEVDQLTLLGVARIESVGSENIYIAKDSLHYYCKVMATENYVVGEWDFVAQRKLPEVEHEYLFDVHLDASITIKATSEEVASGALRAELQCASANLGEILGQTIVCEVSLNNVPVLAMIDCEDPPHRKLPKSMPLILGPSGRFITDGQGRKVAEMFQPGDSPAEQEAIKRRIVGSFNALPDIVGVLLRADKEGALWQALYNEGITDAFDAALSGAVKALGDDGIADVAHRYELDPEAVRAKLDGSEHVEQRAISPPHGM